ncbi:hypothetical protein HNV10_17050 [Winogradskyella litoriviva]|uniref:Uncharacterized protein n=1 Tax=Winogradskyella litoriviva TaxID=1220182 RepID=A0ABX2E9K5_9FLAO|nr:hypothetical protein [Winogradskyella litoriviva]
MSRFLIIFFVFSMLINNTEKINFLNYHIEFSKIEKLIVEENFIDAETKLENLLSEYKPDFAKDYVIASQLSILNNHKSKSLNWIKKSFKKGVKIECLKTIPILDINLENSDWELLDNQFTELNAEYNSKINLRLSEEFNNNYQIEQINKSKKTYKKIVYSNFINIKKRLLNGTYPSEKLIGIDNTDFAEKISECELDNAKITVTLLHYDYPFSELTEKRLFNAIKMGELHPREFAIIYTFEKNKISALYKSSTKSKNRLSNYNFNFPFDKKIKDYSKVNSDRAKFGICEYEVDKQKKSIEEKFGMKLRFGYR